MVETEDKAEAQSMDMDKPEEAQAMLSGNQETSKSNQVILFWMTLLFFLFVVAEYVGATLGNSLALLGDAVAMSIDVFTYVMNIYAERMKAKYVELSLRMRFTLEVLIPTFSTACLLAVTAYITSEAVSVIIEPPADDNTSVVILFAFAGVNAAIDIVSTILFLYYREESVFYTELLDSSRTEITGMYMYEYMSE
jgi:Co/Zn/Cd efflux system component